jgi:hypothetical protein
MILQSSDPRVLAEVIGETVDAALRRAPSESRRLMIARAPIDIRVEQEVAPFLLQPFAHLRVDADGAAVLRADVAVLRERDALAMELERVPDSGAVISAGDSVVHLHRDAAAVFDRADGRIHALVRNTNGVASWQRAKPLHLPLSIFFADRGVDLLHGGLVSLRGNGVLIAGVGGSGKSTLTIASLLAHLDFLGDDCVAAERRDGRVYGYSVYGSTSLERAHLRSFPVVGATRGDGADPKTVLPVAQLFDGRIATSTTIRAIVLPRVTRGEHVTVTEASAKEALLTLAPSSILKRAVPAAQALARMAQLVREVPAYRLEMGPIAEAGTRVRALLEELGA